MPRPEGPKPKSFSQLPAKVQQYWLKWEEHGFAWDKRAVAAMEAGYSLNHLAGGAKSAITSVSNNEKMQAALRKRGVNFDFIAINIKDKFTCTRPIVIDKKITYVPDNSNQLRAIELATKMKDGLPSTKVDINEHRQVEIYISHETVQRGNKALEGEVIDIETIESEFVE